MIPVAALETSLRLFLAAAAASFSAFLRDDFEGGSRMVGSEGSPFGAAGVVMKVLEMIREVMNLLSIRKKPISSFDSDQNGSNAPK